MLKETMIERCIKKGNFILVEKLKNDGNFSQITDNIYIGSYYNLVENPSNVKQAGIEVIFNCSSEMKHPENIQELFDIEQFDMMDGETGITIENILKAASKLNELISLNKKVFLHCHMGISRSPSVVVCYLMQYQKFSFEKAYSFVKEKRNVCDIDSVFVKYFETLRF